jgi:peptide/nickel transport system permease protein
MRLASWSLILILLFAAPWLSPHDPLYQDRQHASVSPQCGQPCFLLGTDAFGRDVLSRTLHGARLSLLAGLAATVLALGLGAFCGTLAGTLGGVADELLSRPFDLLMAMPWFYLLLALRAAWPLAESPDLALLQIFSLLGLAGSGAPFRLARNEVRAALQSPAVQASFGLGANSWHVFRFHLLPATIPALAAQAFVLLPQFVAAEVSLVFLGLGVGEPSVTWGAQLAALRDYSVLVQQWWMFAPVVLLAVVTLVLRHPPQIGFSR